MHGFRDSELVRRVARSFGGLRFVPLAHVRFLAESRDVESGVFLGRADPHRGEDVDDAQDHVRPGEGEGRHDDAGQGLDPELARVPVEQAVRGRVDQGRGEQAGRERSPDSAGPVACEDVEGVIERRPRPPAPHVVAQDPGDEADDDRRHRADVSGGGRDGHQAADGPDRDSNGRRLLLPHPVREHPADGGPGGGQVRDDESVHGQFIRFEGAPGVEAEPAEPQHGSAEDYVRDVIRPTVEAFDALASPDDEGGRDRGNPRGGVDDQAAREVEDSEGLEETAEAPVPVRDRNVDERRPEDDVDQEGLEPEPLREGADDQGGRDRGELQLEREVQEFRYRVGVSEVRSHPDVVQSEVVQAPDERIEGRTEGERVPPQGPDQTDDREDGEALGDRRDEVLPSDEPAVEEAERGRHDHDEGRGRDDPRDVSVVERQVPLSAETDFGRQSDTAYNASRPAETRRTVVYTNSSIQIPFGSAMYAQRLVGVFVSRTTGWPAFFASSKALSRFSTWNAKWSRPSPTTYSVAKRLPFS